MTKPVEPVAPRDMLTLASQALGKVDLWGRRGLTMLSMDEIEAMALTLASVGLIPTAPGATPPEVLFTPLQTEL